MATEIKSLEAVLGEMPGVLGRAACQMMMFFNLSGRRHLTAADVDAVDLIYCDVEAACDAMRRALVARQTARTARYHRLHDGVVRQRDSLGRFAPKEVMPNV
jgi:hypothetical protein